MSTAMDLHSRRRRRSSWPCQRQWTMMLIEYTRPIELNQIKHELIGACLPESRPASWNVATTTTTRDRVKGLV